MDNISSELSVEFHFNKEMKPAQMRFKLQNTSHIAIAVSGGSDSLALLFLLNTWCVKHHVTLTAITVDHNIRPESANEALYVKKLCKKHEIHHVILTNTTPIPSSNIMAYARDVRYNLMMDYCHQNGIFFLAAAHHQDDQVETYQLMKQRNSGSYGKAAMSRFTHRGKVIIFRPLLDMKKDVLSDYLTQKNITWIEDPTNRNTYYKRNNIRMINKLSNNLDKNIILTHIDHFQQQKRQKETQLNHFLSQALTLFPYGVAHVDYLMFSKVEESLATRVLSRILSTISGKTSRPRFDTIKHLYAQLVQIKSQPKYTLHGVTIKHDAQKIIFFRETANIPQKDILLRSKTLWDGRFTISPPRNDQRAYSIFPFTDKDRLFLLREQQYDIPYPKEIALTFPVIKITEQSLEKIVSIPHIGYSIKTTSVDECVVNFTPNQKLSDYRI